MEAIVNRIFDYAEKQDSRVVFWTIVVATFVLAIAGALISVNGWWEVSPWLMTALVVATFDLEVRGKKLCVIKNDSVRDALYNASYIGGIVIYIALRIMQ